MFNSQWYHGGTTRYGIGGTMIIFLREIPPMSKYHMYSRFIAWSPDNKWFYCQTKFTIDKSGGINIPDIPKETVCAVMYSRYCWKLRSGKTIPITKVLEDEGYVVSEEMLKLN